MKIKNLKLSKNIMSLLVAGSITITPISIQAITDNTYNPGTFVKRVEQDETVEYGEYIVKAGDNLSRISEKVCSHLRIDISTKYWPVLAFLNNYPRIIKPGDIIIFPKTAEKLEEINNKLLKSGWTSKYKQTNKVYGIKQPKKKLSINEAAKILDEHYNDDVCIDEDFIKLYLKIHGLDDKYILSSNGSVDNDTYFALTEWIPTIEELDEYKENNRTKTKKK